MCHDNIVILKEDNVPRNCWQLARVAAEHQCLDGRERMVKLALADACLDDRGTTTSAVKFLERPIQKLVLLMSKDDYKKEPRGKSQPRSP